MKVRDSELEASDNHPGTSIGKLVAHLCNRHNNFVAILAVKVIGETVLKSNNGKDDWVTRLKSADPVREQAIGELRELLVRGLTRSLSTKYGTGIQPDDVVQEALMKILSSLDQFEGRSKFTTWAMTVATRVGISKLRRKHFRDVSLDAMTSGEGFLVVEPEPSTADQMDRQKILSMLQNLIRDRLTEKQRQATQGLLSGLPVEEIARRSGSNRNAVYKLIHDARIRLREGFAESGVAADDINVIFA